MKNRATSSMASSASSSTPKWSWKTCVPSGATCSVTSTSYPAGVRGQPDGVVQEHLSNPQVSGDQNGLAGQLAGGGLVVDGGQIGQRPPLSDVDLQVAGVDAGDQLVELGGVTARGHLHRPHPAPRIGGRAGGADEGAAVGGQVRQGGGLLRICARQVEHHVEPLPGHRLPERGSGVVDDPVRAVGADPAGAARAGGRGDDGTARLPSWTAYRPTAPPAPLIRTLVPGFTSGVLEQRLRGR